MQQLLDFLYRQREIGVFVFLEILCVWLLINYNQRFSASYFNSSNEIAASITQTSDDVSDYFSLAEINERLVQENSLLQKKLSQLSATPVPQQDTVERYSVISARVISNTINRSTNFITVSAGQKEGIEAGMGVINSTGIVGQVKSVSPHYATIYSVLHPNLLISSKVKRTQTMCTVQWGQQDYQTATLRFIPRHIKLQKGDTIVTSGYNSVFPEGILVGVVHDFQIEDQMTFYEASIKLSTDLTSLENVYLIRDVLKTERDSLERL